MTDNSREEFEKHISKVFVGSAVSGKLIGKEWVYDRHFIQERWETWQARQPEIDALKAENRKLQAFHDKALDLEVAKTKALKTTLQACVFASDALLNASPFADTQVINTYRMNFSDAYRTAKQLLEKIL